MVFLERSIVVGLVVLMCGPEGVGCTASFSRSDAAPKGNAEWEAAELGFVVGQRSRVFCR